MSYKIINAPGVLCWPGPYADLFDVFYPKSITIEKREGWNPPNFVKLGKNGVNKMGMPGPGAEEMKREVEEYKGNTDMIMSVHGDKAEMVGQVIDVFEKSKASKKIIGYEINISCPNTGPGETCTFDDKERINEYIRTAREKTSKKIIIKFSPLVNPDLKEIKEAGTDGVTISNTVPCEVYNKYSGKLIIKGGLSGPILLEHTLMSIKEARESGDLDIYASGGFSSAWDAYRGIKAGATQILFGTIYKGMKKQEIKLFNQNVKKELADLLKKNPEVPEIKEPEWWAEVQENGFLRIESDAHKEYEITEVIQESIDTYTLVFDKSIEHVPGQYVMAMIWDEDTPMERPFTLSSDNSITIKRVGPTTKALTNLKPGDKVYINGPKGNGYDLNVLKGKKVLVVGGGCGVASLTDLAKELEGTDCVLGFKKREEILKNLENILKKNTESYEVFINDKLPVEKIDFKEYDYVITCGPEKMMQAVAEEAVNKGLSEDNVLLIIERIFKCVEGLCGACDCGERACLTGPVYSWSKAKNFYKRDKSGTIVN